MDQTLWAKLTCIDEIQSIAIVGPGSKAIRADMLIKRPLGEIQITDGSHRNGRHPKEITGIPKNHVRVGAGPKKILTSNRIDNRNVGPKHFVDRHSDIFDSAELIRIPGEKLVLPGKTNPAFAFQNMSLDILLPKKSFRFIFSEEFTYQIVDVGQVKVEGNIHRMCVVTDWPGHNVVITAVEQFFSQLSDEIYERKKFAISFLFSQSSSYLTFLCPSPCPWNNDAPVDRTVEGG